MRVNHPSFLLPGVISVGICFLTGCGGMDEMAEHAPPPDAAARPEASPEKTPEPPLDEPPLVEPWDEPPIVEQPLVEPWDEPPIVEQPSVEPWDEHSSPPVPIDPHIIPHGQPIAPYTVRPVPHGQPIAPHMARPVPHGQPIAPNTFRNVPHLNPPERPKVRALPPRPGGGETATMEPRMMKRPPRPMPKAALPPRPGEGETGTVEARMPTRPPPPISKSGGEPEEAAPEEAAPEESPEMAAEEEPDEAEEDYSIMKVYYGTDRMPLALAGSRKPVRFDWLTLTFLSAAITMILTAVALRLSRVFLLKVLAGLAVLTTAGLGLMTAFSGLQGAMLVEKPLAEKPLTEKPSNQAAAGYGGHRGNLVFGTCEVAIPKAHEVGELESPSVFRLEFREDPTRHVVLLDTAQVDTKAFFEECQNCVKQSGSKDAFVFVHGYNVTFEDAARRTAQIAYDLKFDGLPMFYSWPSQGTITGYMYDETNVQWTVPHLRKFLTQVAERSGARQVHLIAHSMGNRALTAALRDLSFLSDEVRPKFQEVVLTAPDIDAEVFRHDIAPAIVKTAQRVTLYASSNDKALAYSKTVHGYPRAGDSGGLLVVIPGIETIDVSTVDTSFVGHSYYASNDTVLADLFEVLHDAKPADQRTWLRPERLGALRYWTFRR